MTTNPLPENSYFYTVMYQLKQEFRDESLQTAGNAILDFLATTDPDTASRLSFGAVHNIIKRRSKLRLSDHDLLDLIAYLSGGRARLLDTIFHYKDPETQSYYLIPQNEMKQVFATGEFYHPLVDDELVQNYEDYLIVSYAPSDLAKYEFRKIKQENLLQ